MNENNNFYVLIKIRIRVMCASLKFCTTHLRVMLLVSPSKIFFPLPMCVWVLQQKILIIIIF